MSDADRHAKSLAACSLIAASPEFAAARVRHALPEHPDRSRHRPARPARLAGGQDGRRAEGELGPAADAAGRDLQPQDRHDHAPARAPRADRRQADARSTSSTWSSCPGSASPRPATASGAAWGSTTASSRSRDFLGLSCGLAFEEQVVADLPVLDHDMPLSMLATDRG